MLLNSNRRLKGMIERLIYPEWLDAGEDALAEKISELEIELRGNDKEFKRLFEEKHRIIKASPSLRTIFDADEPKALTEEDARNLVRVIALDNRMRNIIDRAIFVYGRKNAYMFMRSIGMA
jgi:hypothetical protein